MGLRFLLSSMQSESCCLEKLILSYTGVADDRAEVLAHGLAGNTSLKYLHLFREFEQRGTDIITPAGWSAFVKVLCDTSTINNTYLSNHTIQELWEDGGLLEYHRNYDMEIYEDVDRDLDQYLSLNAEYPQHAARCKILMSHAYLDMTPLLKWELKCLPLVIAWFEKAKPCLALSIDGDPILEESDDFFHSRILTALYELVRGAPKKVLERRQELTLMTAYDNKIAMAEQINMKLLEKIAMVEQKSWRLRKDVEERDIKIAQLEQRLGEMSQLAREISQLARG